MRATFYLAFVVVLFAICVAFVAADDDSTADKVADYIKEGGKKVGDFAEDALEKSKKYAKDAADSISDAVQKGYKNIKENAQPAEQGPWDKIKGIFGRR